MEGLVTNLVSKSLKAMGNSVFKEAVSWWGARAELEKLENTLRMIQARVRDAEKRQEADGSEAIKEWLRRLKLVLYTADDLLDEVLTRDRQEERMESIFDKVGFLVSTLSPLYHIPKLAYDIKSIRKQLDAIESDMSVLNLRDLPAQQLPMARLIEERETASFVNTDFVISRDNDQNNIMDILFDPKYDAERVTVIPIVGFGGLGKTTLAQLVFSDQKVRKHFALTKWAYVPEVDNLRLIMRKIYNSFMGGNHDNLPLEQIKQGIRESIANKKYLLVLDDIWDEGVSNLNDLISLLKCGKQGSKVIVTTRSDVVARVIGTIDEPYMLGTLTDGQSWDLFKSVAFKQGKEYENSKFTKIGKEIVTMCGNVPLAIKVVGGFLRTKDTEKEWLLAQDAQCSKAQLTKGSAYLMDVLKLSYDNLTPAALKQCFAYCSLFPKGYRFDRDVLVYMWMAQGYFEPSNNETGDILYMNMLARGFFQDPEFSDDGNVKNCRMHDLAQHVAGEESMILHDESSIRITNGLLHVNRGTEIAEAPSSLFVATRMRSFLSTVKVSNKDLKDLISRMQHLRVLQVNISGMDKLPRGIGRLMHLRYLYIESDEIEYLPDSITRLKNLQTLDVQQCIWLYELPSDFAKLTSINHLLLPSNHHSFGREFPVGFGKLRALQVLNKYIVGVNNGIDSLPVLNYRGELFIRFAKWRTNCILEVQRANLKYCDQLTSLVLWFNEDVTPANYEMNEMLMNLELPPNLRNMEVWGYKGDKMPSRWFDGLSNLVSIRIMLCTNCKVVPHLSHLLPHLKKLELEGLDSLEEEEEEGNSIRISTEWQGLTSLRKLSLNKILNMKSVPTGITSLTTLEELIIKNLNNLIELPEEFGNLSLLRQLYIWDCPKLKLFPTSLQGLTSLESLEIRGCPELKSLPKSLLSHTSLQCLFICESPYLEERYSCPNGKDCHLIQHIPGVTMYLTSTSTPHKSSSTNQNHYTKYKS